ncbi:hypothetical protein BpHYR1_039645 [Brachionus plicatilis]|uniref:Uncharacterized protein n=1 Tax=Brachionus plicatilis TaxID=10195 RepID=A0A3M7S834_BRAPC|nr:hypothetical protein BpHYR1_039645 [Brachionus plicatilis]
MIKTELILDQICGQDSCGLLFQFHPQKIHRKRGNNSITPGYTKLSAFPTFYLRANHRTTEKNSQHHLNKIKKILTQNRNKKKFKIHNLMIQIIISSRNRYRSLMKQKETIKKVQFYYLVTKKERKRILTADTEMISRYCL